MLVSGSVDECHRLSTWKVTQTTEVLAPHRQGHGSTQRLQQLWESFSGALMSLSSKNTICDRDRKGTARSTAGSRKSAPFFWQLYATFHFFCPFWVNWSREPFGSQLLSSFFPPTPTNFSVHLQSLRRTWLQVSIGSPAISGPLIQPPSRCTRAQVKLFKGRETERVGWKDDGVDGWMQEREIPFLSWRKTHLLCWQPVELAQSAKLNLMREGMGCLVLVTTAPQDIFKSRAVTSNCQSEKQR